MSDGVETAKREFDRWRQRERRIVESLKEVDEERRRLEEELQKVAQQVAYYASLTRDMKREYGRPGLSGLMSSLRRP